MLGYFATEARQGFMAALLLSGAVVPGLAAVGLGAALWRWWHRRRWLRRLTQLGAGAVLLLLGALIGLTLFHPVAYRRYRQRGAEAAAAVRAYQRQHGRLPARLAEVPGPATAYATWLHYQPATDGRSFALDYRPDGWHSVEYQSRTGRWLED